MARAKKPPLMSGLCCLVGASAWTPVLRAGLGASGTEVGHSSQDEGLWRDALEPLSSIGPAEEYVLAEADWVSGDQRTERNLNKNHSQRGKVRQCALYIRCFCVCAYTGK